VAQAQADGRELVGRDGLVGGLLKLVLEAALQGEMDAHLGRARGEQTAEGEVVNHRNGTRPKTVVTDVGPVEIDVPRDRNASFDPQIVRKRQRRMGGVDQMVLSLSARGLTHGEISAHLQEIYGVQVSKATITAITDRVVEAMTEWQNRPLDPVYAVLFIDAIHVKVRDGKVTNRPIYVVIGVTAEGCRDILGLWIGDGGEGAEFWAHVLTELRNRGLHDALMVVCDGLKGLPEAIGQVWPQTITQTCIVHRGCQESRCWFSGAGMFSACLGRGEEVGSRGVAVVGGSDRNVVGVEDGQDVFDRVPEGAFADVEQVGEGVEGADAALVEDGGEDPVAVGDLLAEDAAAGAGASVPAALAVAALFDRCGVGHDQFLEQGVQRVATHPGEVRGGQRVAGRVRWGVRCRVVATGPGA
jgi:hypothetical protein